MCPHASVSLSVNSRRWLFSPPALGPFYPAQRVRARSFPAPDRFYPRARITERGSAPILVNASSPRFPGEGVDLDQAWFPGSTNRLEAQSPKGVDKTVLSACARMW